MDSRFRGELSLPEGEVVPVELVLDEETLVLVAEGAMVGSWPLRYCRVKASDGQFSLSLDGETVGFRADDPREFALAAAQSFQGSSLAERIDLVRGTPPDPPALRGPEGEVASQGGGGNLGRRGRILLGFAGLATVLVVAVTLGPGTTPDVVGLSPPPTTLALEGASIFERPPTVFVEEWNRVADEVEAPLLIRSRMPASAFEVPLTPSLTLQGTVDDDGSLSAVVLSADPTAPSDQDELAMAAWGIAIAVVDPDLSPAGRREVLGRLGLDVADPRLVDLDGEVEVDGVRYSLRYLAEFTTVLFTVTPASSPPEG